MEPNALESSSSAERLRYLHHLSALSEELNAAMEAVGTNTLERFEQSVGRQEMLCDRLRQFGPQQASEVSGPISPAIVDTQGRRPHELNLAVRIREAETSLRELNLRYAALIEHSSESARLFAGLCRSYRAPYLGAALEPAGARAGQGGISCDF